MKFKSLTLTIASIAFILSSWAHTANATLIEANITLDLSTLITGTAFDKGTFALDSAITVNNGDTVQLNIDFLGDQYLNWTSNQQWNIWLLATSGSGNFQLTNATNTFLGLTTGVQFDQSYFESLSGIANSSCCAHLGVYGNGDGGTRTFKGVREQFIVNYTSGDTTRTYSDLWSALPMFDGEVSYGVSQSVPEPSTLAIFALGMIGLASRRFKK